MSIKHQTRPSRTDGGVLCPRTGFTLVELSIASVIALTLLSAIMLQFFQASSDWLATTQGQGFLRIQLSQVMNSLNRDVQEARGHTSSCCGGAYTEDLVPPDITLILQVPSTDTNGTVNSVSSRYDYIIYQFNSTGPNVGKLQRTVFPDPSGTSRPIETQKTVAQYLTGFTPAWAGTSNNRLQITQLVAQRKEGRWTSREPPLNDMMLEFSIRNWSH